jgi:predicted dehydrogenase
VSHTRFRVGVVGIGFGQAAHVPAFRSRHDCEVLALAATDLRRAERAAAALGVPRAYADWRELVAAPDLDIVAIAVPPIRQPQIGCAAARAGKHVFCEKPVAADLRAARELFDAAEGTGVGHAVDFEFPDLPEWQELHTRLRCGEIGPPRRLAIRWRVGARASGSPRAAWKDTDAQGGGVLGGFACHALYHTDWLLGPACELRARLRAHEGQTMACAVDLRTTEGAEASVEIDIAASAPTRHLVEVTGARGVLRLENRGSDHAGPFQLSDASGPLRTPPLLEAATVTPAPSADRRVLAVTRLVARFVDALHERAPFRPSLRDGVRVQELLDAVLRSAREGSWVTV